MSELELSWVMNKMPKSDDRCLEIMSIENVEKARRFHMKVNSPGFRSLMPCAGYFLSTPADRLFIPFSSFV